MKRSEERLQQVRKSAGNYKEVKKKPPIIFGKKVKHKFQDEDGTEKWYDGIVAHVYDDEHDFECLFGIKYAVDDYKSLYEFQLLKDWQ